MPPHKNARSSDPLPLPASRLAAIQEALAPFSVSDLYAYLSLPNTASEQQIRKRLEAERVATARLPVDAERRSRQRVEGLIVSTLLSPRRREQYDLALRQAQEAAADHVPQSASPGRKLPEDADHTVHDTALELLDFDPLLEPAPSPAAPAVHPTTEEGPAPADGDPTIELEAVVSTPARAAVSPEPWPMAPPAPVPSAAGAEEVVWVTESIPREPVSAPPAPATTAPAPASLTTAAQLPSFTTTATPPPPPTSLLVTPGTGRVSLRWEAPPPEPQVAETAPSWLDDATRRLWAEPEVTLDWEFVVVRREGRAPTGPQDGHQLAAVAQTTYEDETVAPGVPYFYAVFTRRGNRVSDSASVAGPVIATAEVNHLRCFAAPGRVELRFSPPEHAAAVLVRRMRDDSMPPAGEDREGALHEIPAGRGRLVDQGLPAGRYHYRVCCVFATADGSRRLSEGVAVSVMVPEPGEPPPVTDLSARDDQGATALSWTPPAVGRVQVLRFTAPLSVELGEYLIIEDLPEHQVVPLTETPGRALDRVTPGSVVYYLPVTLHGGAAVAGVTHPFMYVTEFSGLRARNVAGGLRLTWDWGTCQKARILVRTDRFAESAHEPGPQAFDCVRASYERDGFLFVPLEAGRTYFITVHAVHSVAGVEHYAAGAAAGARTEVFYEPPTEVYWRLLRRRGVANAIGFTARRNCTLPIVEVRVRDRPLVDPRQGEAAEAWGGLELVAGRELRQPLAPGTVRRGWYLYLFWQDPEANERFPLRPPPRIEDRRI